MTGQEASKARSVVHPAAFAALVSLWLTGPAGAQPVMPEGVPAILSDPATRAAQPLPDFSYAGYRFGLAPLPDDPGRIIDATSFGVVPNDGKDDAKALLRAIEAAGAVKGRVTIRLPAGRVQIGEIIPIERSELILAGAGSDAAGTELYFPRPLKIVDRTTRQDRLRAYLIRENKFQREPDQNIDHLFSEYSWSGGFLWVGPPGIEAVNYDAATQIQPEILTSVTAGTRFSREITVERTDRLRKGQVVQLQWPASNGEASAILRSLYGDLSSWNDSANESRKLKIGSHHWSYPGRAPVTQTTRITSILGNKVILGDPLLHDAGPEQPAQLSSWDHLTGVGIQGMRLSFPENPWFGHHLEQGYNGIYFTGVFDGWVRDLVIENADSGILTDNAASITIENIKTTGTHKGHYSVHLGAVHNVLVKNLIVENMVVHPLSVNTRSTRSVYLRAKVLRDGAIDQHSGANHQNLFDQAEFVIRPVRDAGRGWTYRLWAGSGADYWKPGHGLFNTHWNVKVTARAEGYMPSEPIHLISGLEGPGARIIGLHGDGPITFNYAPTPYAEMVGQAVTAVPSLYDFQLARRKAGTNSR